MRFSIVVLFWALLALCVSAQPLLAVHYIEAPPLRERIKTPVGEVRTGTATRVPLITWGGDEATILANGNNTKTQKGSIFAQKGLNLELISTSSLRPT